MYRGCLDAQKSKDRVLGPRMVQAIIKDKPEVIDVNEREEVGPSNKMATGEPSWGGQGAGRRLTSLEEIGEGHMGTYKVRQLQRSIFCHL